MVKAPADSVMVLDSLVLLYRISNNHLALKYSKKALQIAKQENDPALLVKAYNILGNANNPIRKDSSFYYYTKAIVTADSFGLKSELCRPLLNLAEIYIEASNLNTALALTDSCIKLAQKFKRLSVLSDAYILQGQIYLTIYDSIKAKKSFTRAFEIGVNHKLSRQSGNALANLSFFELDAKKQEKLLLRSLEYYRSEKGNEEERSYVYINLGNRQSVPDSAIFFYKASLSLSETGALSESRVSALNNLTYSYIDKCDYKSAMRCISDAIFLAKNKNVRNWLPTLYDTKADVLIETGNLSEAITIQKQAYKYKNIVDNEQALSQTRILAEMLDMKNKDALIQQRTNDLSIEKSTTTNLRMVSIILILTILTLVFLQLWIRQKNLRRKIEIQNTAASKIIEFAEIEKRRLGFELHDHVGFLIRSIYQFINNYKFGEEKDKEKILARINELKTSIRRFSHNLNPHYVENENLKNLIVDLISDFSTFSSNRISYFIGNKLPNLQKDHTLHIIRILQELITNSSKHAPDSDISIKVSCVDNIIFIIFRDTGPGFETEKRGYGLQSIEERVKILNGRFKLKSVIGNGVFFQLEYNFKNK